MVQWTREQQKIIDLRNRNILVAAAAGSGKTAVLVERILSMVCDKKNPVDIDRLLVVTFTKAAAAEMRERIAAALEQKAAEHPEDSRLARQKLLAEHTAQITTIDSFCMYVLRNHFQEIGLDPSFRVADEGELALLKADVLEEYLEEQYEIAAEEFQEFADCYSSVKGDGALSSLILDFYELSQSYPWPLEWIERCGKAYQAADAAGLEQEPWIKFLLENTRELLRGYVQVYDRILQICGGENGPALYLEKFSLERERLNALLLPDSYQTLQRAMENKIFEVKPRKKKTDIFDEKLAETVSSLRDSVRKGFKDLREKYFSLSAEEVIEQLAGCSGAVQELCRLTSGFSEQYIARKRRKNLLDFSDLEHLALQVLVDHRNEGDLPTPAAEEYSRYFEEIMIDEYQDSNQVQEALLNSISRERRGRPNVFMVGDVKQSIYKFRLARPELFMEKYEGYSEEDSLYQKVELRRNFRSRKEVLEGVNFLFYQMMQPVLGGVAYTEEAALYPGAQFETLPEEKGEEDCRVEMRLLDAPAREQDRTGEKAEEQWDSDPEQEGDIREWEARLVAEEILRLTDEQTGKWIWDKEEGRYRRARYGDIVVLLRTVSGWAETFVDVLGGEGIPAYAESQQGFFDAPEVQMALNLLRLIDNPMQDIPLAAVLKAPFVGCSSADLAEISAYFRSMPEDYRNVRQGMGFYGAVKLYSEQGKENLLSSKLSGFLVLLDRFREKAACLPLHELLQLVLEETGYQRIVSAMPMGSRRRANLEMLEVRAENYEKTSYRGVFHFIRYVERLQKYEVDYGEAPVLEGQENTVRLMSIHKSKGLEFPVVIAAGLGKQFNQQDARQRVVFHPDLGIGLDLIDGRLRTRRTTLVKRVFQKKLLTESLGEELRVLYVALTRAKEYLILTGGERDAGHKMRKRAAGTDRSGIRLSYPELAGARCYLDWLIPALYRHRDFAPVLERLELPGEAGGALYGDPSSFDLEIADMQGIAAEEQKRREKKAADFREGRAPAGQQEAERVRELVLAAESQFGCRYSWEQSGKIPVTMSVSELKRQAVEQEEIFSLIPRVTEGDRGSGRREKAASAEHAARRGTAWHHVLELLDLEQVRIHPDWVREELERLVGTGSITEEERNMVSPEQIQKFADSPLCARMVLAAKQGKLHREEQFVIGVPAAQISPEAQTEDGLVMVQGVIDVWLEEEDGLVIVDYKTDRVPLKSGESILLSRYQTQLDYYAQALSMARGQQVKEKYLYSFSLGKAVKG